MNLARTIFLGLVLAASAAQATPSTTYWTPATPYLQPFGVLHITYDTYFGTKGLYPIDVGLGMGVLPMKELQLEIGFDLFYPTGSTEGSVDFPIQLNAKVGTPEDTFFQGQPGWSFGIYGVGFEEDVNDYNILHLEIGKTLGPAGTFSVGGYYGLHAHLLVDGDGDENRAGFMASWLSPAIDVPVIDKIYVAADVQTGKNAIGGGGAGVYLYFTPAVSLLTGPVFFFEDAVQPGSSSWMWTAQLDVDVDFASN